jgi:hypothetical protein
VSSNCSTPGPPLNNSLERSVPMASGLAPLGNEVQQLMSRSSPNSSPWEFQGFCHSIGVHYEGITL